MKALILVDIQNDFLPGGALPVPGGDEVVAVANRLIPRFELVVATKDWHPPNHVSFASNHPGKEVGDVVDADGIEQILWPDHCVQGSPGAEFVDALNTEGIEEVFLAGNDRGVDSYSGFFDNARRKATGLEGFLRSGGVDAVYILGLATDYCVKYTALDAAELGFATYLIVDGCRGVDLHPGDVDKAIEQMQAAGVEVVTSETL